MVADPLSELERKVLVRRRAHAVEHDHERIPLRHVRDPEIDAHQVAAKVEVGGEGAGGGAVDARRGEHAAERMRFSYT